MPCDRVPMVRLFLHRVAAVANYLGNDWHSLPRCECDDGERPLPSFNLRWLTASGRQGGCSSIVGPGSDRAIVPLRRAKENYPKDLALILQEDRRGNETIRRRTPVFLDRPYAYKRRSQRGRETLRLTKYLKEDTGMVTIAIFCAVTWHFSNTRRSLANDARHGVCHTHWQGSSSQSYRSAP